VPKTQGETCKYELTITTQEYMEMRIVNPSCLWDNPDVTHSHTTQ